MALLTLKASRKFVADDNQICFHFSEKPSLDISCETSAFSEKTSLDISCESKTDDSHEMSRLVFCLADDSHVSAWQTIHMKCQDLLSLKNKNKFEK